MLWLAWYIRPIRFENSILNRIGRPIQFEIRFERKKNDSQVPNVKGHLVQKFLSRHTHTHTHTGRTALPGPLKWSVTIKSPWTNPGSCSLFGSRSSHRFSCHGVPVNKLPLPSNNRHHRSNSDCLEGKWETYHVCSVQCCVQQLCTVQCTHMNRPNSSLDWVLSHWAHFTVLTVDSFLCMYCMHVYCVGL